MPSRRTRQPTTSERGYPTAHKRLRARIARDVATGTIRCARGPTCHYAETINGQLVGGLIHPDQPWDLDHHDQDRSRYLGPSHAACNRATMSHRPPRARPAEPHPGIRTDVAGWGGTPSRGAAATDGIAAASRYGTSSLSPPRGLRARL